MGLDVIAYSKATFVRAGTPTDDEWEQEAIVGAFAYRGFHRSTRGLVNHDIPSSDGRFIAQGVYDVTFAETRSWRAGSYSGYGVFREHLAELGGIEPYSGDLEAWVARNHDKPFFELVWFADNEGCIGQEAARDLLADFQAHRAIFREGWPDWSEVYDDWLDGLALAASGGLVEFR